MPNIYNFNGKDVTLIFIMKIVEVCKVLANKTGETFKNILPKYYSSNTYKVMKDTQNGLWLEPAGYIANQYLNEIYKDNA